MSELGNGGGIFSSWPVYVLIISAVAGFVLQQSALKTGFLAPAMAALNAATLAVSVVLGVAVFQEALSAGRGRVPPAIIGLVIAIIGVLLLASAPPARSETPEA